MFASALASLIITSAMVVSVDANASQTSPTICIAVCGDSTVASYPEGDPNKLGRGWGQMLARHFQDNVRIVNLASGGQSSKSFLDQKAKFQAAMDLKPQFVFIQFGHNDGPGKGPARETDPNTTYSDNLRMMIGKAHAIGAECILVTPMERRGFDKNGKVSTSLLGPYAAAMKRVGREKDVFVIDLHDKSVEIYEKMGKAAAQKEFSPDGKDGTHFNAGGAKLWADIICQELAKAGPKYDALKSALKKPAPVKVS
jgi:lysophospholipase L1-like esterase